MNPHVASVGAIEIVTALDPKAARIGAASGSVSGACTTGMPVSASTAWGVPNGNGYGASGLMRLETKGVAPAPDASFAWWPIRHETFPPLGTALGRGPTSGRGSIIH